MMLAVAVLHLLTGKRGNAVAREDDSDQVARVCSGDGDELLAIAGARFAEGVCGFGEGELLPAEAGDEAATAEFATVFEATQDGEEITPAGGVGLAGEEVAEEHAVAEEEDAGG